MGTKREEHVEFRALDPWYSYYFHTGETFDYRPEISDTLEEIEKFNPDDKNNYLQLLAASEKFLMLDSQSYLQNLSIIYPQ